MEIRDSDITLMVGELTSPSTAAAAELERLGICSLDFPLLDTVRVSPVDELLLEFIEVLRGVIAAAPTGAFADADALVAAGVQAAQGNAAVAGLDLSKVRICAACGEVFHQDFAFVVFPEPPLCCVCCEYEWGLEHYDLWEARLAAYGMVPDVTIVGGVE